MLQEPEGARGLGEAGWELAFEGDSCLAGQKEQERAFWATGGGRQRRGGIEG